jgi:hypothetical protein
MKKIIIGAALAVVCAISANAASVNWGFSEQSTTAGTYDFSGYTAYLFTATDWAAFDGTADYLNKSIDSSALTATVDTSKNRYQFVANEKTASGIDSTKATSGFYIVLANDKDYWASSKITDATVYADGDNPQDAVAARVQVTRTDTPITAFLLIPIIFLPAFNIHRINRMRRKRHRTF